MNTSQPVYMDKVKKGPRNTSVWIKGRAGPLNTSQPIYMDQVKKVPRNTSQHVSKKHKGSTTKHFLTHLYGENKEWIH